MSMFAVSLPMPLSSKKVSIESFTKVPEALVAIFNLFESAIFNFSTFSKASSKVSPMDFAPSS